MLGVDGDDLAGGGSVGKDGAAQLREILHIRDSRLYAPRDFDISPYFEIVKPALHEDFDYHRLAWGAGEP